MLRGGTTTGERADRGAFAIFVVTPDLGRVVVAAEFFVNDRLAGACYVWPYRYDIIFGIAVTEGNVIDVKVSNTPSNCFSEGSPKKSVVAGQTVSGLLGPVKLRVASYCEQTTR